MIMDKEKKNENKEKEEIKEQPEKKNDVKNEREANKEKELNEQISKLKDELEAYRRIYTNGASGYVYNLLDYKNC